MSDLPTHARAAFPLVAARDRPCPTQVVDPIPARRRWLIVAVVAAGYLLQVGWRLWLNNHPPVPTAHADEDGYLLAARALAGGSGGFSTENTLFRRVGFPMLLAPLYLGTDDPFLVYRRVRVLTALISSLVFPLSVLFARRVLAIRRPWAVGLAMVTAALPAVVFYSGMAMTDAILPTLTLAWLLSLHRWMVAVPGQDRIRYGLAAGLTAGLMSTVHIRGAVVAAVQLAVVVLLLVTGRTRRVVPALAGLGVLLGASVDSLGKWILGDSIILLGVDPSSQVSGAFTVRSSVLILLYRTIGQLWYLTLGTFGLGTVGLLAAGSMLVRWRWRERDTPRAFARGVVFASALMVTVLVALGSAASLSLADRRITYFAYPRYLHFTYPVWFLFGFAILRAARRAPVRLAHRAVWAGALSAISAVVVRWATDNRPDAPFIAFDVPELLALSGQWQRFTVVTPTLAALCLLALLAASQYRRRTAILALPVMVVLLIGAASLMNQNIIARMVDYQYSPGTPQLVRDLGLGPGDFVVEARQVRFPYMYNHTREVYWHRIGVFDAEREPPPARATVVIAPWYRNVPGAHWDGTRFGMRQIAAVPWQGWAAWRLSPAEPDKSVLR